jgi:hypothetical protein
MEKKQRTSCFVWNVLTILILMVLIYINYKVKWYALDHDTFSPYMGQFVGRLASAFILSLLLQKEEILTIVRRRRTLVIHWELIFLTIIVILLALIKLWFPVLFPNLPSPEAVKYSIFSIFALGILESTFGDIAFMFLSGFLLVRAFNVYAGIDEEANQ